MKKCLHDKRYFLIELDPFKTDVLFFINYTHKEIINRFKNICKKDYEWLNNKDTCCQEDILPDSGRFYSMPRGYAINLGFTKNNFRKNVGLLVHEVSHLVNYLLLDKGVVLELGKSDEIFAYTMEDVVIKFLNKWY
jgi:hypothetical protein